MVGKMASINISVTSQPRRILPDIHGGLQQRLKPHTLKMTSFETEDDIALSLTSMTGWFMQE